MKPVLTLILCTICGLVVRCQVHFTKFKAIKYCEVFFVGYPNQNFGDIYVADLDNVSGLKGVKVQVHNISGDSSQVSVFRNGKLFQRFDLPFVILHFDERCRVADIDNNKKPDIKIFGRNTGTGLAANYTRKVYLFNEGTRFKLFAFFDFSTENEYDINGDGMFEILSCDHVSTGKHSYWVYHAFNFSNGKLKNLSRSVDYPLWTRHLNKSDRVVATDISRKDRNKEYIELPAETIIR